MRAISVYDRILSAGLESQEEARHPLIEPSLFYDPPYELPLEDEFAWHLVKYLNPVTALAYQQKIETPCAHFWVDFVVEQGGRRIGFECGNLEEPRDEEQERFREALMLGAGGLDVLYRFRAVDLLHRLHDCLYLAARWEKELFSKRGHINLDTLASAEARSCPFRQRDTEVRLSYPAPEVQDEEGENHAWPEGGRAPLDLVVHRISRDNPAGWVRAYDQALAHFGVSDDQVGERWARSA